MSGPAGEPDILTLGSDEAPRLPRRVLAVLAVLVLTVVAGFVLWRQRPTPPPAFTLADLRGVYAGMVRSDGTNDASVIDTGHLPLQPGTVEPAACGPLFEATVLNRPSAGALDGVGTFWALGPTAVSLFSFRFAGPAGADAEFARLAASYDVCQGVPVDVRAQPAATGALDGLRRDGGQLAYSLRSGEDTKLAVHVLLFSNTVTWQFRYEPTPSPYAPQTAQNVMDSLADQMRSVQDLHG